MKWLSLVLLLLQGAGLQGGKTQPITPLSFDGREFKNAFNATSDRPRLVMVFSPTCPHCLKGASEAREVLERMPEAKLKVLTLWSPILRRDSKGAAERATAYLSDPRTEHFWDLWTFGVRTYTQQFQYPQNKKAWDIFILYDADLTWGEKPPETAILMQHRDVEIGTKYNQKLLEKELARLTGVQEY